MIDYDKLKIAQELVTKVKGAHVVLKTTFIFHGNKNNSTYVVWHLGIMRDPPNLPAIENVTFENLDCLISTLQELTGQLKPKYKIGDEVWYIVYGNEWVPISGIITAINPKSFNCYIDGIFWPENQLFPTKQTLIESQIEYWQSLSEPLPMREVQKAPFLGKLSAEQIQRAVDSYKPEFEDLIGLDAYPKQKECQNCHQLIFTDTCPCSLKCQHEADSLYKYSDYCINPPVYHCKKCGEFYR